MQNKNKLFGLFLAVLSWCVIPCVGYADDEIVFDDAGVDFLEDVNNIGEEAQGVQDIGAATAVANYNVQGSIFQQITDLEQQKVLMELEKERAQLDLDLDRLTAEKIKLQMEMDTLSGRAEQERQILQNEKSRLEAEAEKIEQERRALAQAAEDGNSGVGYQMEKSKRVEKKQVEQPQEDISAIYKLVNVMGAGNQLQATLSDLETGQTKRVSVGKIVNGFTVKSISLEDGVVFIKDGETQNLNISSR